MAKRSTTLPAKSATASKKLKTDKAERPETGSGSGSLDVSLPASATGADALAAAQAEQRAWTKLDDENGHAKDDAHAIVARLFEESVERCEKALGLSLSDLTVDGSAPIGASAKSTAEGKGKGTEVDGLGYAAATYPELTLTYARALTGLGAFLGVQKLLEVAGRVVDALLASGEEGTKVCGEAALIKAHICLETLRVGNKLGGIPLEVENSGPIAGGDEPADEDDSLDDDDDGHEPDDEDPEKTAKIQQEVEFMQEARSSFIKGIAAFVHDSNTHTLKRISSANQLRNYALLANACDKKSPVPISMVTFALSILDTPYSPKAPLIPDQAIADALHVTKAACLFHLARLRARDDDRGATQDTKECLRALGMVVGNQEHEENAELTGQAYIFLSTVTPNDTLALAAYERGVKLLKQVLEREPGNELLRGQLQALGAAGDNERDDDEEEILEDEDGIAFNLEEEIDRDDVYSDDEHDQDSEEEDDEYGGEESGDEVTDVDE
ncbi:hypothetical protein BC830DRAFT_856397 [Chytriomyces sp. MP71]|nr:hypothetical protein BC830DRAFT_856397 [Chytriomyces sp. MP71]